MRRREKGLLREKTRHGKFVWYYREGHSGRIRIPGDYGSPEFDAALKAARGYGPAPVAVPKAALSHSDPSSFAWLVDRFLKSTAHLDKEEATQKARRNVLMRVISRDDGKVGASAYRDIVDEDIRSLRDKIASDDGRVPMEKVKTEGKAAMANGTVAILRRVFDWAIDDAKLLTRNPCLGVKALSYEGGTNYVWTEADMAKFEEAYPLGARERLAYALLLYTGQRSSDVALMGRQHVRNGWMTVKQQKTGKTVEVPVLPVLAEVIAASPTGDLTFLVDENGAPIRDFGKWFRAACDKAGVPDCTPHGLRHAGATRLAARGASTSALQGIYGFTLPMAQRYTQTANMRRAVEADIHLLNHVA